MFTITYCSSTIIVRWIKSSHLLKVQMHLAAIERVLFATWKHKWLWLWCKWKRYICHHYTPCIAGARSANWTAYTVAIGHKYEYAECLAHVHMYESRTLPVMALPERQQSLPPAEVGDNAFIDPFSIALSHSPSSLLLRSKLSNALWLVTLNLPHAHT